MAFTFTDIASTANRLGSTISSVSEKFIIDPAKLPQITNGTTNRLGGPVVPGVQSGFNDNPPIIAEGKAAYEAQAELYREGRRSTPPSIEKYSAYSKNITGTIQKKQEADLSASDQRLHVIRSRAARTLYENNGVDTYTSDRGPITTLKLLKGPDYNPAESVRNARSNVDKEVQELISAEGFAKFFVTNVAVSYNEKSQITTTFGDNEVVYYFGRQPIVFNISGLLFDSIENDWFSKFLTLYAGVLRGTQLAKSFSLVQITFPNMIVTGSISSLSTSQDASRDTDITFNMQFIAKEVVPLPTYMPQGGAQNLVGSLIDFKADRRGVNYAVLSSGTLGGGFMDGVVNASSAANSLVGKLSGAAAGVSSTLNSFRTNIFTPVYGVLSSITKIVKSVTGTISSIISSFTNPVNQILRDIQSISSQATGIAMLVENSVNDVISIPSRTLNNVNNTIKGLSRTAGTISRVPENISETFKRLYGSGRVKRGAAILSSGKAKKKDKAAILNSGAPYVPTASNRL